MEEKKNTSTNTEDSESVETSQKNGNGNKKSVLKKVLAIVLSAVILVATFFGGYFANYLFTDKSVRKATDIISIMQGVGYIYDPVTGEEREITDEDIADAIVNAFLDDYSAYYTEEEFNVVQDNSKGKYGGMGVGFFDTKDLNIDQVSMNSPFDRAGIKVGDKIVSVNKIGEEPIVITSVNQVLTFVDGLELEESVEFTIEQNGTQKTITVAKENYVRAYVYYCDDAYEYRFSSTDGTSPKGKSYQLENSNITSSSVGYVRFDNFYGDAFNQMQEVLNFMKSRNKTKLVLDLRNNGGGYMDVFTKIASLFVYNGGTRKTPVAYSKGKTGMEEYSTDKNRFCDFLENMVILANENTASASECLIGAIVTYKDAVQGIQNVIVEENSFGVARTYGKGIMQTTYKLLSGGALKLTTAKILWPDKTTCIHTVGVTPSAGCTVAKNGKALEKALEFFG